MTGQQLKNSILQMAVQGKLVSQDPNDEPASELLKRIRAEKERLVKEGKIKREKNPSVIFKGADNLPYEKVGNEVRSLADEVPFDIPDSWEWVRIRSLGEIVRGSGIKRNETVQRGLPCVRYGELYTTYQTSFTSAVSFVAPNLYEKCKHFSCGDVLMTLTGENKPDIAKAVAYLGSEPVAAGGDLAFWTQHGMNPLFLSYIMASPYIIGRKVALATGDIIVHISGEKLGTILLPVPPLTEQERIVARIQEVEQVIEDYALKATVLQKLQDSFPESLKKSILQEAVQGKLVPQAPNDEPASVLLERIREEKKRLVKEGKIKRDKHESVIFRRGNSHYEKLDGKEHCIDPELPFEIPDSWEWVRLGSVFALEMGQSPAGDTVSGDSNGIEFHQGKIFYGEKYINPSEQYTSSPTKYAPKNSVLLCVRAPVGKVNLTNRKICIGRGLCAITPLANMPLLFVYYLLASYENILVKQATGTTFVAITAETVKKQLIPLPPLAEQYRIVQRIEELLPLIKEL